MTYNQCFNIGDIITSQSGIALVIKEYIGEGGQGQVYEVESGRKKWALKYYTKGNFATPGHMENLKNLIEIGSPNQTFLWPIDLVQKPGDSSFGYIMPLRPQNFSNLIDYVKRRINPTFYSIITASFNLADSFSKLHAQGLCYRDISLGNVFFDSISGNILICDNDNICYNNSQNGSGIGGTAGFIAPEIVMGKTFPNRNTDLYSLSVLLFHLLFISHPLNGIRESQTECWDPEVEKKIHGSEALFIFDPDNDANRPDPAIHQNAIMFWNLYPNSIKKYFIKSFTEGLFNPENGRVRENEWKSALIELRDSIFYCSHCGSQVFFDPGMIKNSSASMKNCWQCNTPLNIPPRIKIGMNGVTLLNSDTYLYLHHLNPTSFDVTTPIAKVSKHPNLELYGLQNLTEQNWIVLSKDGKTGDVPPQKNALLQDGVIIDFGSVKGEIRFGEN
ncbi:protein kinase domain-containing protein [Methanospirillum stamsii]|uniref:Serine/threonine protein kinase n=1 Tax=Methanospirillum stamsii TaxID=1277351 RepID=A0A2V2NJH7_9EURY|nr:serine/threonine protein kinase [Methanospirillum stamsii]PWR75771.1 serine/threonine protein kinase [Methanospirillum stamsii]